MQQLDFASMQHSLPLALRMPGLTRALGSSVTGRRAARELREQFFDLVNIGGIDYIHRQLGFTDLLSTHYVVPGRKALEVRRALGPAFDLLESAPELGLRFATNQLLPIDPLVHFARGATNQGVGATLDAADAAVLERVYSEHAGGAARMLGKWYCNSAVVTCNNIGGVLRVTGLRLMIQWDPARTVNEQTAGKLNPPTLPAAVAELPMLRVLVFAPLAVLRSDPTVSPAEVCRFLQSLPSLEVLELAVPLDASCALPNLKGAMIRGAIALDDALRTRPEDDRDFIGQTVYRVSATPLAAETLTFLCKAPGLMLLEVARAQGLPECLAGNTKLLRVDVRGGQLRGPLPSALSSWASLVDFVAFEQSPRHCGLKSIPTETEGTPLGCKVNFHAKAAAALSEEDEQPLWHCGVDGWVVRFDDPANPWWGWRNLERFWVDVNFLHGTIPPELPDRWPQLRTLDLYSNELTGVVPSSLCKLTQLSTLQLQDNRLSGEFPFAAFFHVCPAAPEVRSRLETLTLALNANLSGCVSGRALERGAEYLSHMTTAYTAISIPTGRRRCGDEPGEYSRERNEGGQGRGRRERDNEDPEADDLDDMEESEGEGHDEDQDDEADHEDEEDEEDEEEED